MARPQPHPILSQLRSARTTQEQTAALRALKNEIVGHVQRKEIWIAHGVLQPIVRTIAAGRQSGSLNGKDAGIQIVTRPLSDDDGTKLQALQLVASFAHGGPAFLAPLHAADALPAILSNISPLTSPPQIVVAALRALTDIADAAALADPSSPLDVQSVAEHVFAAQGLESLRAILSISSPKHLLQTQVTLAANLITKLCSEDNQQHALTTAGVLDSLATRLASFAVREGFVTPGADELADSDGLREAFPDPAPIDAKLGPILAAIASILGDSKYRATRLIYAPATLAVFPAGQPLKTLLESKLDADAVHLSSSKNLDLTAMESVLPNIPSTTSRNTSTSHLSSLTPERTDSQMSSRNNSNRAMTHSLWDTNSPQLKSVSDPESEGVESPLVPWLVHLVRTTTDIERLAASSVLAALYKSGLGNRNAREISIGLLVVPILVEMIAKNDQGEIEDSKPQKSQSTQRHILERAPLVLARLIIDCEYLQKAAFDSKAEKVLTKLLKRAYTPVENLHPPEMWSPHTDADMDVEATSSAAQLGPRGRNPELTHLIQLRESALKAIAALAAGKEEYRKALVAEDLVSYVVESLTEYPGKPRSPKGLKDKPSEPPSEILNPSYGQNPLSVVIAGCHTLRMLSRSVGILRTALVDYGAALPIYYFMKHQNLNVQTAATAAMVNLVIDVSPVRELLIEKGVMAVLCEHAHSDDPALRLNALWALKHFVDAVGPELKKSCLEELESGWLIQLIQDDTQDAALSGDRLRDSFSEDMDEDVEEQEGNEPHQWVFGNNGVFKVLDASRSSRLRQAEDKLAAARDSELDPVRKARSDDIAIQEQGLDFIRNFIGRPPMTPSSDTSETADMIDHLFSELGQDRLFDILASKLRPKVLNPFSRRTPITGREPRVIYPQAQIIVPVIYILVHIAASESRHRQVVITQTELLKLLAQQSTNKDREVRIALCHLVNNLTWEDDEAESESCKQRAQELKKLGFMHKLEILKQEDRDLDVRERAKEAVYQMELQSA